MKVGDIVKIRKLSFKSFGSVQRHGQEPMCGVVVKIHEGHWPRHWDMSTNQKMWAHQIGRRIDVLWSDGSLAEDTAETSLIVVGE